MLEQTRIFLAENRQSMVGIFKRFAKLGGAGAADHHDALRKLTKSYLALITATDFLEVCFVSLVYDYITHANLSFAVRRSGSKRADGNEVLYVRFVFS